MSTDARPGPLPKTGAWRIHCLLHSALGGEIHLPHWAASRGHSWVETLVPETAELPRPEDADCLVVLGGPMSAWDERRHPWLTAEKRTIEAFVHADRPVLGICLGAQMIASATGACVFPNKEREIGWFPVQKTPASTACPPLAHMPDRFMALHWHGETFDLPDGATWLAQTDASSTAWSHRKPTGTCRDGSVNSGFLPVSLRDAQSVFTNRAIRSTASSRSSIVAQ